MSLSPSVAAKGPLHWYRSVSLFFALVVLLFSSTSIWSEASPALSSSFKSLQSRFHTESIPTTCVAPLLSSLSCQTIPWYSSDPVDLPFTPSFSSHVADYTITRPCSQSYSFLRVHLGVAIPIDAQVTVFFNGVVVDIHLGPSLDLFLHDGINTCEIHVAVGTCISVYTIKIKVAIIVAGEILPPFPNCASCPPTAVTSFDLALSAAASATLVPLVVTPPFDPHGSTHFVAYEGVTVFVGGKIHLKINFAVGLWLRYSINGGVWIYGAVSGLEIVALLQVGTNVILFDIIQPGPCGNYIAQYSITICEGPPPGGVVVSPPVPVPPICPPLELISLDVKALVSLSILNSLIPLPISLQVGVFEYTLIRPVGTTRLKLLVTAQVGCDVIVYLNGVIVSPHPVPQGVILDLTLVVGINIIRIDVIKGGCITHYTCTVK